MSMTLSIPEAMPPADRGGWADRIRGAWNKTREGVIEVGRLLIAAKAALAHGEFEAMIERDLPFAPSTAQRLMKIARDDRITNPAFMQVMPPSWGTLYELTKLDDGTFSHAVTKGLIRPDMERKEAERLRTGQRRQERLARSEALAASSPPPASLAPQSSAPARRYPVVYLDPPWRFETWSEKGLEKAAENHYPTMSFDELAALPVGALAARDAALFCWADREQLAAAISLFPAWGFVYKSCCVWAKTNADGSPHVGKGYWFRDGAELLLVATRGDMPAPLPGTQSLSLISHPVGRHSEKPAVFRDIIERYYPGVAKIELFARGALPAGWDGWGNEYTGAAAPEAAA